MPIETEKVLAMRCSECGKLDQHRIRRFDIGQSKNLDIKCSCGSVKLVIGTRDCSSYRVKVTCVYCDGFHYHVLSGKRIWNSTGVIELFCSETGLELGCIGHEDAVRKVAKGREKELEALVEEFGRDEYFHNSQVVYEVLRCLQHIAEKGSLYCQCGNSQIGVDIFPDRLELQCNKCDSVNIIYAETDEDLQVIQQLDEIELSKNGFDYLDSLVRTGKPKKRPGRGRNNK